MSKFVDKSVMGIGAKSFYAKDSIKEVIALARTEEYLKKPAEYIRILTDTYYNLTNDNKTIIGLVKNIIKYKKITTLEEIILKDIVYVLTTDNAESFDKYVGIVDNEKLNKRKISDFKINIGMDSKVINHNDEMNYLFSKLGIRETAMLLVCLVKIVTTR